MSPAPTDRNRLRIIGGRWRGRRVSFADSPGLRPTGDRMRETLFNWLQPVIPGARCLDLFAGSGALGLEALSRGAHDVVMVEREPVVMRGLRAAVDLLDADGATLVQADARRWLQGAPQAFDVVFLDPPFDDAAAVAAICKALESGGWLADHARIYLEQPRNRPAPVVPDSWGLLRDKTAGAVTARLFERRALALGTSLG